MGCSVCHTIRSESLPVEGEIQVYIPPPQVVLKRYLHTDIETNTTQSILENFDSRLRNSILQHLFTLTPPHYTVVLPLARFARSWPNPNP